MNTKKIVVLASSIFLAAPLLTSCFANAFEKEIEVIFMNEGEVVDSGTITQFKNFKTPEINSSYIPDGYKFLGWSCYEESQLDLTNATNFKTQYIAGGRMVHYMEAKPYAVNGKAIYNAVILDKNIIPKDYHYSVLAWYDKAATSGITTSQMETFEANYKAYLANEGVSQDDINSVVVRGYSGNVGPTTGQILFDDDVDVMLGWGSADNITTTGSIPLESILQTEEYKVTYNGADKNRYVHRLTDTDASKQLVDFLLLDSTRSIFVS